MTWQVVIILSLLILASVVCILIAFGAQAKAHAETTGAIALILEAHREERIEARVQLQSVLDQMAEDRDVLIRGVIAKHAGEAAQMSVADQHTAVADAHVRAVQTLDPRRDNMTDPETGEAINLVGVGSG